MIRQVLPTSSSERGATAGRSTAWTAPSGPAPVTAARSIPRSEARRRASGEAGCSLWSPPALRATSPLGVADTPALRVISLVGGEGAALSPSPRMTAIVVPTATSAPGSALIEARVPVAGDSTSTTALSVSISSSGSPFVTCSPSRFFQDTTTPMSWAIPSAGMITSVGI